jgi:membrane fusion protein (multidrug efflux system)
MAVLRIINLSCIQRLSSVASSPLTLSSTGGEGGLIRYALSITAIAALLCGCARSGDNVGAKPAPLAPAAVRVVKAKRGEATRSVTLPGNVVAYQQAALYAKVTGYVKTVKVDKGDSVAEGALLADIEVPELIADRAKYQAELEVASIDFKRIQEAQTKAPDLVVPQFVDAAKGKRDIAKANLERVDTLLGFAKITAPFAGVVTRRTIDPGAFVAAATAGANSDAAMFMLMDFSKVRVQVPVPEPEVPGIKVGLPVRVVIEELPNAKIEGSITRFSHALDDATRTMLAEIELANPEKTLRPGMYANIRIVVETKPDALVVPVEGLMVEKTRNSVFTVADQKAKRVVVKSGFNDAGWVEILEGLKEGDPILLAGKQILIDGQPITITVSK